MIWTLSRVQRLSTSGRSTRRGSSGRPWPASPGFSESSRCPARVGSAFRNWVFDLFCLTFSIRAAGAHVPWWGIVLAWAAGTGGASLNLTPGGLGVVEAALTGALVALGADHAGPDRRARVPGDQLLAGHRGRLADLLAVAPRRGAGRPGTCGSPGQRMIKVAPVADFRRRAHRTSSDGRTSRAACHEVDWRACEKQ